MTFKRITRLVYEIKEELPIFRHNCCFELEDSDLGKARFNIAFHLNSRKHIGIASNIIAIVEYYRLKNLPIVPNVVKYYSRNKGCGIDNLMIQDIENDYKILRQIEFIEYNKYYPCVVRQLNAKIFYSYSGKVRMPGELL